MDSWKDWTPEQWRNAVFCPDCGLPLLEVEDEDPWIGHYMCVFCAWVEDIEDVHKSKIAGLEAEVERLREEIEAIGKAHHKDTVILGGLYLKNQELTTRNLALAEDNIALRIEIDMLREAARWIPVSERLPEEGVAVIVKYESGYAIAFYKDGVWRRYSNWWIDGITHWRPLPEQPEAK